MRPSSSPRARPASPRARSRPTARSPPASMPIRSASPSCAASRRARARRSPDPQDPGQRAAVPRHRRGAGAAQQLRHRPHDGADAEMGSGRGAAADRAREDHLFRRRADDEPRADAASRPRPIRPLLADRHRRRRRAAPGRARQAARGQLHGRPARARLRPHRDQCRRLRQFLVQLSRQARLDRPAAAADRRARHLGRGRPPPAGRRARRDRDPLGRQHPRLLARRGGDRAPPSPPTAI